MESIVSRKIFIWTVVTLLISIVLVAADSSTQCEVTNHPPADNYTNALHKALMFFNAQRSGKLPDCNNVYWRGDSCLQDGKVEMKDLSGGYYDAGSATKFNFPTSFSMTMLSWSVIEYGWKYKAAGELDHVKDLIKWGTDYLLKTFNSSASTINSVTSQVGVGFNNGPNDRYCWMRPEDIDYDRPITECHACSDLAAEMAAALASASLVFKDNKAYSEKLVQGAITLFNFSRKFHGRYSANDFESAYFYNSTGFWDEFIWGAAWLYYATGNNSYLQLATDPVIIIDANSFRSDSDIKAFSWDNKLPGAQVLLTRIRFSMSPIYQYEAMLEVHHRQISDTMCSYLPDSRVFSRTKGGLILLNNGKVQPLQYAANAAFLATLFSDHLDIAKHRRFFCIGGGIRYSAGLRNFAKSQIDYILGNNPQNMSYLVGYGTHYPSHIHHRGVSIPKDNIKYGCKSGWIWRDSRFPDPNPFTGAMVAGPDQYDGFQDIRTNPNYTEPTLAGNAGLVAALVALSGPR